MRALILLLALTIAVPGGAATPPLKRDCAAARGAVPAAARDRAELKRLDQLPRAKQFLTLFRTIDGCPAPVIVRDDIGAAPRR